MNPNLPEEVDIGIDADTHLRGFLYAPEHARGVILFVHGSGSSRFSPRNNQVARLLAANGFAALLMDLLTCWEDQTDAITRELRFNIPMLADRVVATLDWVGAHPALAELPVGLFGASTGAAAALVASTQRPERVSAVVCRGGRPDLACDSLKLVLTPTLMIVGSQDEQVLELNRYAASCMLAPVQLETVAGASHLFEEPGALEQVAQHALDWFEKYLPTTPNASRAKSQPGGRIAPVTNATALL